MQALSRRSADWLHHCQPTSCSTTSRRCASACARASKRDTLVNLTAWPVQLTAVNILATLTHSPTAAAAVINSASTATAKDPMFYAEWPYASPADIIPYIRSQAAPGDSQAVLNAMDTFGEYYPQYKIGPEKGVIFERVLQQLKPKQALEVGTFLGYSAIRTARHLAPGGHLICIEANPGNAAVARQLVQYAGFGDAVTILEGLANQVIPQLPKLLQQQEGSEHLQQQQQGQQGQQLGFDVVFLDHCKDCYLPDLQAIEQLGLLHQGSTVLADNVLYPGPPGFLEYLDSSGRYTTELLRAKYEYEQAWNPDWEPNKEDAISKSVLL